VQWVRMHLQTVSWLHSSLSLNMSVTLPWLKFGRMMTRNGIKGIVWELPTLLDHLPLGNSCSLFVTIRTLSPHTEGNTSYHEYSIKLRMLHTAGKFSWNPVSRTTASCSLVDGLSMIPGFREHLAPHSRSCCLAICSKDVSRTYLKTS
jgi:hypothetical protein